MEYDHPDFPREWLKEVVSYFSAMGFFLQREPSEADLRFIAKILELQGTLSDGLACITKTSAEKRIEYEQEIVRSWHNQGEGFTQRVWFEDAEADFVEGDYWYVQTLIEWVRISSGCFRPQNFSEVWLPIRRDPESGQELETIELAFTLGTDAFKIELDYLGGWFDYRLIRGVNRAIQKTGYQFASVWIIDQYAYVCCLTMEQVAKLKQERGWRFHDEFFALAEPHS